MVVSKLILQLHIWSDTTIFVIIFLTFNKNLVQMEVFVVQISENFTVCVLSIIRTAEAVSAMRQY